MNNNNHALSSSNAEGCAHAISANTFDEAMLSLFGNASLAGAMELFAFAARHKKTGILRRQIRKIASEGKEPWRTIVDGWKRQSESLANQPYEPRAFEVFKIIQENQAGEKEQLSLTTFEHRMVKSATQAGIPSGLANGLAAAFHEMIDNVIQHSAPENEAYSGLAAYHVDSHYVAFSVIDLGQGILASLKRSKTWSRLQSQREALTAIIHDGASAREGLGEGEGFKMLYKQLADRNSIIRMRSRDVCALVAAKSDGREVSLNSVELTDGFHVSAVCDLKSPAREKTFDSITGLSY